MIKVYCITDLYLYLKIASADTGIADYMMHDAACLIYNKIESMSLNAFPHTSIIPISYTISG